MAVNTRKIIGGGGGGSGPKDLSEEELRAVVAGDGEKTVRAAERLASLLKDVKHSQIRKFYVDLLRQPWDPNRIPFLKPRLAYAASRQPNLKYLRAAFTWLLDRGAEDKEAFGRVKEFAEAVVAYHAAFRKEDD